MESVNVATKLRSELERMNQRTNRRFDISIVFRAAVKSLVVFSLMLYLQPAFSASLQDELETLKIGDRMAWLAFVEDVRSAKGSSYEIGENHLAELVTVLRNNRELHRDVLKALSRDYSKLSKEAWPHPGVPKIRVDTFLKYLLDAREVILRAIRSGTPPDRVFVSYVDYVQSYVGIDHRYTGSQVLVLLRKVQEFLRDRIATDIPTVNDGEPMIYVGGSLPNGKANLRTSDLDGSANFEFSEADREELNRILKLAVKNFVEDSRFEVSMKDGSTVFGITGLKFWTDTQPVVIRITHDEITMLAFDPEKGVHANFPIDTHVTRVRCEQIMM